MLCEKYRKVFIVNFVFSKFLLSFICVTDIEIGVKDIIMNEILFWI